MAVENTPASTSHTQIMVPVRPLPPEKYKTRLKGLLSKSRDRASVVGSNSEIFRHSFGPISISFSDQILVTSQILRFRARS